MRFNKCKNCGRLLLELQTCSCGLHNKGENVVCESLASTQRLPKK